MGSEDAIIGMIPTVVAIGVMKSAMPRTKTKRPIRRARRSKGWKI